MTVRACDVLVVGGGVSGMSAAISAARRGSRTLLLEKQSALGGILRAGLGFPVCGLFDSAGSVLNGGLSRELVESVGAVPKRMGRVYVLPCSTTAALAFFDQAIASQETLSVELGMAVTAVSEEGGRITEVTAGEAVIRPKVVIDCSGSGVVIEASSVGVLAPTPNVLAGYSVRLSGIEHDPLLSLKVSYALRKSGLSDGLRFSSFMEPDCLKLAVRQDIDQDQVRGAVDAVTQALKQELPEFRSAEVVACSPYVLQREGLRLKGAYILTEADVLGGATFSDSVAKSAWPVEQWCSESGQQLEYLPDGVCYEIPLRCLCSPDVGNLLAAGRCISATSRALASARVMGTCIATGEAAGKAAVEQCR